MGISDEKPNGSHTHFKVGVFGHYGRQNLGDESLTAAVIANVRRIAPDAEIMGFSLDPNDTTKRYGVPAAAIRSSVTRLPAKEQTKGATALAAEQTSGKGLVAALKRVGWLRRTYEILHHLPATLAGVGRECWFAGYNQMFDFVGGAWEFPYTLFKWTAIAALRNVKVALVSVGAGPLDGKLARFFVRGCLARAQFVSVRDEGSRELVEGLGYERTLQVSPDLAFSLPTGRGFRPQVAGTQGLVAINPMPVFDPRYWPESDPEKYRRYVRELAAVCSTLVRGGRRVVLFGTHPADEWAAEDVLAEIGPDVLPAGSIELIRARSLDEVLDLIERSEAVVATRFHGIVLSLLMGTPTVGVCYYRKSRELMGSVGVGEYAVDFDDVTATGVLSQLDSAIRLRPQIVETLRRTVSENRSRLERQYQDVLGVSGLPRPAPVLSR